MSSRSIKRAFDFFFAMVGLMVLTPLIGLVALLIRLNMGPPVFFSQQRPGLGGKPFRLLKFRTMSTARAADGALLPESERLTALGKFLRRLSLDELPQLINVLKGEMSLVGPRPLLMQYLPRYSADQARRHEVPPGITGWAQVNGRNAVTWDDRFACDVWYVEHWSLALDCRILLRTVGQVLLGRGISPRGEAVMPEFMGAQESRAAKPN